MIIPCYFDRDGRPIDRDVWARLLSDDAYRAIASDAVGDDVVVSTVWLGLNHDFGGGVPLIFETMDFPTGRFCRRYATKEQALEGHREIVAALLAERRAGDR